MDPKEEPMKETPESISEQHAAKPAPPKKAKPENEVDHFELQRRLFFGK